MITGENVRQVKADLVVPKTVLCRMYGFSTFG
jgi:hypothetical protein